MRASFALPTGRTIQVFQLVSDPEDREFRITNPPGADGQPHFVDLLTIGFASARTTGGGPGLYTIAPAAVPPVKAAGTTLGDAQPG